MKRSEDSSSVLNVASGVTAHPLDSELILYDSSGKRAFVLNATGKEFWDLCAGGQPIELAARSLAEKYGLEYEEVFKDFQIVINDLIERGLILSEGSGEVAPAAEEDLEKEEDEIIEAARRFVELTKR